MSLLENITARAVSLIRYEAAQSHATREVKAFAKRHKHFKRVRYLMGALISCEIAHDLPEAYRLALQLDKLGVKGKAITKG